MKQQNKQEIFEIQDFLGTFPCLRCTKFCLQFSFHGRCQQIIGNFVERLEIHVFPCCFLLQGMNNFSDLEIHGFHLQVELDKSNQFQIKFIQVDGEQTAQW